MLDRLVVGILRLEVRVVRHRLRVPEIVNLEQRLHLLDSFKSVPIFDVSLSKLG